MLGHTSAAIALALLLGTPPLELRVETSLPAHEGSRPESAVDGDPSTAFASSRPAHDRDDFTLTLSRPVEVRLIEVTTGRPDGTGRLDDGILEVSADDKVFRRAAAFEAGRARVDLDGRTITAVSLRPTQPGRTPLVLREVAIASAVPITRVEVVPRIEVDTREVPDLADWGLRAKTLCERWYPRISDLLASPGYRPPHLVELVFKANMEGIAATSGARISIAAAWVRGHPDDLGMVIHELTHVVQSYPPSRDGWLVEGIADYVRIRHFEPDAPRPLIHPQKASYRDGYKTTARFLAWVESRHEDKIVGKLNQALREARYRDELFKDLTGHDLDALWREFTASLRNG